MSKRLFVGSLPWSITSEDLKLLFERIGSVTDAVVIADKKSGKSKGYGFVELANDEDVPKAIEKFNGYDLKGRAIVVNEAAPKSPKTLFMR
jgi:cold-inducible RNA-binding protein